MTIEDVEKRIEEIREQARRGDSEGAHCDEDALREEVLQAIAEGAANARELARLALTTNQIEFSHWYA
jgi:leucyl aminopeptidase (aminopeptidase T)